jgi:predicted ATPase
MRQLPTGTVTFLFTDIEGSTKLLREFGDGYAEVLADHHGRLRQVWERHRGIEVDTAGDAFFVVFGRASDAVAAAGEAQRTLEGGLVRVRMGLHTGEPQLTKTGYVGMDVHRAARIAAAGHGGQVLVSQATRDLVEAPLRDLGPHRLKDLAAPERLYQLGDGDFAPLRSLHQTNLPVQPTPLIGRERELGEVVELIGGRRLVTMTGAGGIGKTRLALEVAAELTDQFEDGVVWVPLAPVPTPDLVEATIAAAVGANDDLGTFLGRKRVLLLLDNFEHIVGAAPRLADLLGRCPGLRLLVTSRTLLRIAGETEYCVDPLAIDAAVALFRDRAAVSEPTEAVIAICRRLDGLPLAVELAAARTRILPPDRLLGRLTERLPLLTSGRRDAPERQRTLRATIEWSYDLLPYDEQKLFARLSVFAGSFELEAAEEVCDGDVDAVESLVEQSLVRRWGSGRLGMLETIRELALEKLETSVEADALRRRHALYFARHADEIAAGAGDVGRSETVLDLDADIDNYRAALAYLDASGDERFAALVGAIWPYWGWRGARSDAIASLVHAVGRADALPPVRRWRLFAGLAMMTLREGDVAAAKRWADDEVRAAEETRDAALIAYALRDRGGALEFAGDFDNAVDVYEQSARAAEAAGDAHGAATSRSNIANVLLTRREYERAREVLEPLVPMLRDASPELRASAEHNLGLACLGLGRPHDAAPHLVAALRTAFDAGMTEGVLYSLASFAALEVALRRFASAARLVGAIERLSQQFGLRLLVLEQRVLDEAIALARTELTEATYAAAVADGRALTLDDAVAQALAAPP